MVHRPFGWCIANGVHWAVLTWLVRPDTLQTQEEKQDAGAPTWLKGEAATPMSWLPPQLLALLLRACAA